MGQVFIPSGSGGFSAIVPIDRLIAKNAGSGQTGDHVFFVMQDAGQNSDLNHFIAIGDEAGAGGITNNNLDGTVIIGASSLAAFGANANGLDPFEIFGPRNAPLLNTITANNVGGMVIIGSDNLSNAISGGDVNNNVMIGLRILGRLGLGNAGTASAIDNILMGVNTVRGVNGGDARNISTCIIIGNQACQNWGTNAAGQLDANVVIGFQAAQLLGNTGLAQHNVLIGTSVAGGLAGAAVRNTIIGDSANANGAVTDNVIVGYNSGGTTGGNRNVILGANVAVQFGSRNIVIGNNADVGAVANSDDILIVGTSDGVTQRTIIFGDMNKGALIVGKSTQGVNRDLPGTNLLKILNGTTTGAPVGGGYFYVVAGALHWVGSAGTDTVVAPA